MTIGVLSTHSQAIVYWTWVWHSHIASNMRGKSRQKILHLFCSCQSVRSMLQIVFLVSASTQPFDKAQTWIRMGPRSLWLKYTITLFLEISFSLKSVKHFRRLNAKIHLNTTIYTRKIRYLTKKKTCLELIERCSSDRCVILQCRNCAYGTHSSCVKMLVYIFLVWIFLDSCRSQFAVSFKTMESSSMRNIGAKSFGFNIELIKWSNRMDLIALSNNKSERISICLQTSISWSSNV